MIGGIVFAVAMVIAVPVGVMFAGAAWSALFGELASSSTSDVAEADAEPEPEAAAT